MRSTAFAQHLRSLFTLEQWQIGWAKVDIDTFLRDPERVDLHWIAARGARRLLADPFGIEQDGALTIVAERMVHGPSRGEIVSVDPSASGGDQRLVLRTDAHLSYPFIVHESSATYLVPEQGASGALKFYRLDMSGASLRVDATPAAVIDGLDAIDPTFLHHDGRWWLFCTRNAAPNTNAPLLLFHAASLFGPYTPHPGNPIVADPARARPAGRIIRSGSRLIRPAQDCAHAYGRAIVLNEIVRLSPTEYEERTIGRIEPTQLRGAWCDGTHHIDHTETHILVDSKRVVFYPFAWLIRLRLRWRERRVRGRSTIYT